MKINFSQIKESKIYLLLIVFTFVIYGNSINNEYSLDDNIVAKNNPLVEGGFKSIPKIFKSRFSTDAKQSYDYRPVVTASFAIEKQFFSKLPVSQTIKQKLKKDKLTQANISHFINVLLYALTCIVLFKLLRVLFKDYNKLLPLVIVLIFLVHPLHTEVVDNIKSRDELLTFLFIISALFFNLKYASSLKIKYFLGAIVFILLSVLSKKSGLGILGLLPVTLYFTGYNYKKILFSLLSVVLAVVAFKVIKHGLLSGVSSRELKFFENPLFFSDNFMDRITVGLYCSWFYLKMLIFPKDLSFYYGYNQIPMANWSFYQVWLAILFYVPLGGYGLWMFIKRKVLGLGIVLWLGLMLAFINVLFPIVGIVADRFTYQFSLGFCIVVGYLVLKAFKIDLSKEVATINLSNKFLAVFAVLLLIYSARTIIRNPNWHDEMSLYNHDIKHLTESAKANALLSNVLYPIVAKEMQSNPMNPQNKKEVERLIYHYQEAIRIDSTYLTSINNLGSVYLNFQKDYDKTILFCSKAVLMDSNYLEAQFNLAYAYNVKGEIDKAMPHYARVMEINPDYMQVYQRYNKMVIDARKLKEGITLLKKVARNVQNPKNIYLNIGNLYSVDNYSIEKSLVYFVKAFEADKTDKQLCNHISTLYNSIGNIEKANFYFSLCNS